MRTFTGLSRRALLTGSAALLAGPAVAKNAGTPGISPTALPSPALNSDPVFAAMEAHRSAHAFRVALLDREEVLAERIPYDERPTHRDWQAWEMEEDAAANEDWRTWGVLLATQPTTPVGFAAFTRYAFAHANGLGDTDSHREVLEALAGALERFAGVPFPAEPSAEPGDMRLLPDGSKLYRVEGGRMWRVKPATVFEPAAAP